MPTHGALSKAGKVRSQTSKGITPTPKKRRPVPRLHYRRNYEKRVILGRNVGQFRPDRRRRRR